MMPMNASGLQVWPVGHSESILQSCAKPQVLPFGLHTRVPIGISPQQIIPLMQSAALIEGHIIMAPPLLLLLAPLPLPLLLLLPPLLLLLPAFESPPPSVGVVPEVS